MAKLPTCTGTGTDDAGKWTFIKEDKLNYCYFPQLGLMLNSNQLL
jgi:hypothetical protein